MTPKKVIFVLIESQENIWSFEGDNGVKSLHITEILLKNLKYKYEMKIYESGNLICTMEVMIMYFIKFQLKLKFTN